MPIDAVKGIVEQIVRFGQVTRPVMGLVLARMVLSTAARPGRAPRVGEGDSATDVPAPAGVLILGVVKDGPADRAGARGTERDPRRTTCAWETSSCASATPPCVTARTCTGRWTSLGGTPCRCVCAAARRAGRSRSTWSSGK